MGVVWRARDERIERHVAVKELVWPDGFTAGDQQAACRHAAREAWIAAQISHRNVIQVFDLVEVDGCPWIVTELLPSRSLHHRVQTQGPLSPQHAAAVGLEVLAALQAAHRQHILHLDVKPANILLAADRVVLTDFGIAMVDGTAPLSVGPLIGSPAYIAPERARGQEPGPPADLWGLGATLYAAVEGRSPFDRNGDPRASLAAAVRDEPVAAVRGGRLRPVISGLLRKNPATRLTAAEAEPLLRQVATAARVAARPPREASVPEASAPGRHAASQPRRQSVAGTPPTGRLPATSTRREMAATEPWAAAG